ncbi:MAG: ChaN family lipoprotein [Deltaproteobacteria bacterium]|nr:ChaN family lipoprotein [Deltaproteobacteria bacterium]
MKTTGPHPAWLLLALMVFMGGCIDTRIIRVEDNREIDAAAFAARLRAARIILVGEVHNEMRYHELQLSVIRTLRDADATLAIGMEMFNAEDQDNLDRWVAGTLSEPELESVYSRNWKVPWENYRDILRYARANRIPVVGLNVQRPVVHQVFASGLESLTSEQKERLPGVRCDPSPAYAEFIRKSIGGHEMKGAEFKNFCDAQMVWDTAMAWAAIQYLKKHAHRAMVIIAGGGHTWKYGIPEQIKRLSNVPYVVVQPQVYSLFNDDAVSADEADYVLSDRLKLFGGKGK